MFNRDQLNEEVFCIIKNNAGIKVDSISPETTFEYLAIDSISFVKVMIDCEMKFDIQLEDILILESGFPDAMSFVNYVAKIYNDKFKKEDK